MKPKFYFLKTLLFLAFLFILGNNSTFAQRPFVTLWRVSPSQFTGNIIKLPIQITGTCRYEWEKTLYSGATDGFGPKGEGFGDGSLLYITLPDSGTYRIKFYPTGSNPFNALKLGGENYSYRDNVYRIEQWGDVQWGTFYGAFTACKNLEITATDVPDLSLVKSMAFAFAQTEMTDITSIDLWDVSNVTDMSDMFNGARNFNGNVSGWSTGNATMMERTFQAATSFNQNINSWNVGKVVSMRGMFSMATSFNSPLYSWDVSKVKDMSRMFYAATNFNRLLTWNVGNVETMYGMFDMAASFNQDITSWNVDKVEDMDEMFKDASSFNQDLGSWDLTNMTNGKISFERSGMSCENFSRTIQGWAQRAFVPSNVTVKASGMEHSNHPLFLIDREQLTNKYHWLFGGDNAGGCKVSISTSIDFIAVWNTTVSDPNDKTIQIPATGGYKLIWEEVADPSNRGGFQTFSDINLTLPHPGIYRTYLTPSYVENHGLLNRIEFNGGNGADKLMKIENWGGAGWTSFENAFKGCSSLHITAVDKPYPNFNYSMRYAFANTNIDFIPGIEEWDMSRVMDLSYMFADNQNFYQYIGNWNTSNATNMEGMFSNSGFNNYLGSWNVSKVTNMKKMFQNNTEFDQPLDTWNVGNVMDMSSMFEGAENFNQDLSFWNTSKVTNLKKMFSGASSFSQPIENWNVSQVTNISGMFMDAAAFNQPINNWVVSNVTDASEMFKRATNFNQPISSWNVENVTNMRDVFSGAVSFNQPIGDWDVGNVEHLGDFVKGASAFNQSLEKWYLKSLKADGQFDSPPSYDISFAQSGLDCENYSQTLRAWAAKANLPRKIRMDAAGISYSPYQVIQDARNFLTGELEWEINDDNVGTCSVPLPDSNFVTIWRTDISNGGRIGSGMKMMSADHEIVIPAIGDFIYSWEELDEEMNQTGVTGAGSGSNETNITFPSSGVYRVRMYPDKENGHPLEMLEFNFSEEALKLMEIQNWGTMRWSSMSYAFSGAKNLKITGTDIPDLRNVEDMSFAFAETGIDSVPNMNDWNVSNVRNMSAVFERAPNFNEDISNWDVSKVTDMSNMFLGTGSFNQPLNNWSVGNVVNMNYMFYGAGNFNQPLSNWDVSHVKSMYNMFSYTYSFNQPLTNWNLASLSHTGSYPNDLSFLGSAISCESYSRTLQAWAANPNTATGIVLEASGKEYSPEIVANRDHLLNDFGWNINGDMLGTCTLESPSDGKEFITVWKTDNPGVTNNNQIQIYGYGEYNYTWEEVSDPANNGSGSAQDVEVITFPHPGIYRVYLTPTGDDPLNAIHYSVVNSDNEKLTEVQQWGNLPWSSLSQAFYGCFNLKITATDKPNLTNTFTMDNTFNNSGITTVPGIENWDVSNIIGIQYTFQATEFNQSLNDWDVSNVRYLSGLFYYNELYNQPMNNWNVSKVIQMPVMFDHAISFNQPLNNWDVSNVKNMYNIFNGASTFDQPLNKWNLRSLEHQPTLPNDFSFANSGMSCENYSITLNGWAANPNTAHNIVMDATGLMYSPGASAARNHLINDLGWTITGDALGTCTVLPVRLVDFTVQPERDEVKLQWTSADEQNFNGYSVERGSNANSWNEIGFVDAKTDGQQKIDYDFYDQHPLSGTGVIGNERCTVSVNNDVQFR